MNDSIEIKGRTILFMALALASFSFLLLFLNKLDNDKKIDGLQSMLNKLDRFESEELQSLLLELEPDSSQAIENIRTHLSAIYNEKGFENLKSYSTRILLKNDAGYHFFRSSSLGRPNSHDFSYVTTLSSKEEEIIEALNKPDANINEVILEHFSFLDFNKVIYPLAKNETKSIYLHFPYFESH